jgi:protein SCO1/2
MARLREKLGPDGNKFEIVFVSVDPKHDSPKTVADYVDLFGTPIIGLTGSDQQIAKVAKSYGVYVEKVPLPGGDFTIDHTASIFLMDRNGELVSTIDNHEDPKVALEKLEQLVTN